MLHEALQQAYNNNITARNFLEVVTLPKITKKEMRVLSPEEHKKVLEAATTEKNGFIVTLPLATGMRIGELIALKWSGINFTESSVQIRRNLNRLKNYDEQGYIFASSLGDCIEPRTMQDVFKRVITTTGIVDANFHSLRHPYVKYAPKIFLNFFHTK